jgi:hypothetical protein
MKLCLERANEAGFYFGMIRYRVFYNEGMGSLYIVGCNALALYTCMSGIGFKYLPREHEYTVFACLTLKSLACMEA